MEPKKRGGGIIKQIPKQPTLYLGILVISITGCRSIENREIPVQPPPNPQAATLPNNPNFVTEVVREVGQAVVRIDATRTVEVPAVGNNPLRERFWHCIIQV
jgi:hypothetical protein